MKFKILILAFLGLLCPSMMLGGSIESVDATKLKQIVLGANLYDSWYDTLGMEKPKEAHPSYPQPAKIKNDATWRCKECHGWDTNGKEGAYSKGSHSTGIKGLREFMGKPEVDVIAVLNNGVHRFNFLPEEAKAALAAFVVYGQLETNKLIEYSTKKVISPNNVNGGRIFQTTCAHCHGVDGKLLNFKTPESPEYIGTIASTNPWEALHKARFGHPNVNMPSVVALPLEFQRDLLGYAQTLPTK